jgi:hypothetical protein
MWKQQFSKKALLLGLLIFISSITVIQTFSADTDSATGIFN